MEERVFPPHVVGFMNRKREKEKQQEEKVRAQKPFSWRERFDQGLRLELMSP